MRAAARCFKSRADETCLKILWLRSGAEELCAGDVIDVPGLTQSKAFRHRCSLYNLDWVTDRRDGLWMNYRLGASPGSPREKLLKLLDEILASQPEAQALREHLAHILEAKPGSRCAKRPKPDRQRPSRTLPETLNFF